jgi:hypothetical protein
LAPAQLSIVMIKGIFVLTAAATIAAASKQAFVAAL